MSKALFSPLGESMLNVQMTSAEFEKIRDLIYRRAGIVLADHKKDMAYNRLMKRIRALKLNDFSQYLQFLEKDANGNEWQEFINALTTNLTSFFRESHHFDILEKHARARGGNYCVWSAAASTGEEPCSIAMTLDRTLGTSAGARIWATDIDTQVLQHAQRGVYRLHNVSSLPEELKRRYFLRGTGEQSGQVKIRKEILSSICYQSLNLLSHSWNIPGPFDAIFCRNVMIYFDKDTQQRILRRFSSMLKPGGLLFTGHSENFSQVSEDFYLIGQTVYGLVKDRR